MACSHRERSTRQRSSSVWPMTLPVRTPACTCLRDVLVAMMPPWCRGGALWRAEEYRRHRGGFLRRFGLRRQHQGRHHSHRLVNGSLGCGINRYTFPCLLATIECTSGTVALQSYTCTPPLSRPHRDDEILPKVLQRRQGICTSTAYELSLTACVPRVWILHASRSPLFCNLTRCQYRHPFSSSVHNLL